MTNNTSISQFKLGKYNIDLSKLSNEDKIKFVRIENLLKELIKFYENIHKYTVEYEQGHQVRNDENIQG